ncbi:protein phosphatase 2C domain-containing protein [Cardiosporidium cionae]|uniref:protein-serine/threonine phosphatase n=1 Tax=Cardiosporidium cionae TaxID=476202 RepID=A0ABQ7J7X2_9APIC|nr:protein phosphatase 2C domain-containing protein [Cardiosporidium cionae]|eukprot:KAF8820082.1 protein phosphatase 2C domain-containing protein [Cardiosporidium cionae]
MIASLFRDTDSCTTMYLPFANSLRVLIYDSGSYLVSANAFGEKGVRKQMEDEHLVCFSLRTVMPSLPPERDFSLFAIFDGHGGRQCAAFSKEHIAHEIASQLIALPEDVMFPFSDRIMKDVITASFSKIDSRIATEIPSCKDGCTVLVVLVKELLVYIASLGDSAAFLCRKVDETLQPIPLAELHKPWVLKEKERIIKCGGTIENGRVNGILEVTRSFGDISLKRYGVLCNPTFRKFEIDVNKDKFILLGCDGFWNCWTAQEVVSKALDICTRVRMEVLTENRRAGMDIGKPNFDAKSVCKQLVEHVIVDKKSQVQNFEVIMISKSYSQPVV